MLGEAVCWRHMYVFNPRQRSAATVVGLYGGVNDACRRYACDVSYDTRKSAIHSLYAYLWHAFSCGMACPPTVAVAPQSWVICKRVPSAHPHRGCVTLLHGQCVVPLYDYQQTCASGTQFLGCASLSIDSCCRCRDRGLLDFEVEGGVGVVETNV